MWRSLLSHFSKLDSGGAISVAALTSSPRSLVHCSMSVMDRCCVASRDLRSSSQYINLICRSLGLFGPSLTSNSDMRWSLHKSSSVLRHVTFSIFLVNFRSGVVCLFNTVPTLVGVPRSKEVFSINYYNSPPIFYCHLHGRKSRAKRAHPPARLPLFKTRKRATFATYSIPRIKVDQHADDDRACR